jgi:hypothetical protein
MGNAPSKWTRTGPGTYKDQYNNILKNQNSTPTKNMAPAAGGGKSPGALAKDPTPRPAAPAPQANQSAQQAQGNANTKKVDDTKFKYQENKQAYAGLNADQQARYRRILQNKGRAAANEYLGKTSGKSVIMPGQKPTPAAGAAGAAGAAEAQAAQPTPESVTEQGFMGAADAYGGMLERFQGEQYQPNFEAEMERARQNIMGQFDRRNAQAFAQQRQNFETAMANRGIAPGGEQYNRELKALTDRQDMARQEAMGAAEQAAYGVQQQQFGQAGDLAMRPYEQWGVLQQPYMAGIQAQYQSQEATLQRQYQSQEAMLQRQFEEAMRRGDRASAERIARMSRGGGGGGGQQGPTLYDRMEMGQLDTGYNQPAQQNPFANIAQGVVASGTQAITNRLNK